MSIDYAWEDLCPKYQYFGIVLNLTTGHALGFHLTEKNHGLLGMHKEV